MDLTFQVPVQYCSLQHPTFTTRHIHTWASCPLCPSHFILSGAISNCPPLFPSSLLDTFDLEGSSSSVISFCLFILFVGVLQARILEWVDISFSSGPHFVRTLHYDPSVLGGPIWHGSWLHWVMQAPLPWQGCDPEGSSKYIHKKIYYSNHFWMYSFSTIIMIPLKNFILQKWNYTH